MNFEKGFIDVGILKAKTHMRRHAQLTDNLRAWLQPIAKPVGKVISGGLRKRNEPQGRRLASNGKRTSYDTRSCPTVWRTHRIRRKSHSNPVMTRTCYSNIICTSCKAVFQHPARCRRCWQSCLVFRCLGKRKTELFSKVHVGSNMDPRQPTPSLTGVS